MGFFLHTLSAMGIYTNNSKKFRTRGLQNNKNKKITWMGPNGLAAFFNKKVGNIEIAMPLKLSMMDLFASTSHSSIC